MSAISELEILRSALTTAIAAIDRLRSEQNSIPSTTEISDQDIESACMAFVLEADSIFPGHVWPNGPDDTGHRGEGGYVRLLDENSQIEVRSAMRFALETIRR